MEEHIFQFQFNHFTCIFLVIYIDKILKRNLPVGKLSSMFLQASSSLFFPQDVMVECSEAGKEKPGILVVL